MEEERKTVEFIDQKKEKKEYTKRGGIKDFLDGSLITREIVLKNFNYLLFLTVLALFYIANRYHAEKIVRQTVAVQNELKELRSEAITVSSKMMKLSRQSAVYDLIKRYRMDLIQPVEPARKIVIEKEN